MFRNDDTSVLRREIDRFKLPMFIAELNADSGHFELLALNTAHEAHSGMVMDEVINRPLHSLMPYEEAEAVNERYARCVSNAGQIRYREMLHMPRGPLIWDTTLHHVQSYRGLDRVVGSAIVVERVQRDNRDTLAFEDVRYFAATSSFKLEQISTVLDAAEKGLIDPAKLTGSAGMLAGLPRHRQHNARAPLDRAGTSGCRGDPDRAFDRYGWGDQRRQRRNRSGHRSTCGYGRQPTHRAEP